ncbi:succinylglutamate desuccinylase [Ferrimonas balearica]|uniref:succinylglutamate desuccinylase n=1 Tax=Ferrimonas balearica TaxID=44012 RepID=UPI001C9958EB|nr:succinylglutamate desuccinylase [Ferrimonas balearica]MBY5920849.1 succinylglutamate desuccinylase [Ferrimonas balearica]MBY5996466.1 succinylglutamate desuccinylase [Ferrimonas balearica]
MVLQQQRDLLDHTLTYPHKLPAEERFTLDNGVRVHLSDVGVLTLEPSEETRQDVVLSAGVHGNETAPIEMLNSLVKELLSGHRPLKSRLLVLLGNPAAMVAGKRELEVNLNRLFSGAHRQGSSDEHRRAALLEQRVRGFFEAGGEGRARFHYDLHTAIRDSQREKFAIYPFRHGRPWRWQQIDFLASGGVNTILLSHSPTTTFSYFSSNEFGADAFTVELGKVHPFGKNDLSRLEALKAQLGRLLAEQPLALEQVNRDEVTVFDVAQVIDKHSDKFAFTFEDNAANFTPFPRGHLLATDGDKAHHVKAEQEAIVFPNAKVANGQRALLTVVPVGSDQPFE